MAETSHQTPLGVQGSFHCRTGLSQNGHGRHKLERRMDSGDEALTVSTRSGWTAKGRLNRVHTQFRPTLLGLSFLICEMELLFHLNENMHQCFSTSFDPERSLHRQQPVQQVASRRSHKHTNK